MFTSSRLLKLGPPWLLTAGAVVLLAADPSWKSKPASNWTEEDARQVLTSSPWAKMVRGTIVRRQTEDERREGGNMGPAKGVGFDGIDDKRPAPQVPNMGDLISMVKPARAVGPAVPTIPLMLRWESALPVRVAELKSHVVEPPTLEGEGYSLAVYGVPGTYFKGDPKSLGKPLKEQAILKREGKKNVKPLSVEVFLAGDGLVIVYLFPLSAEISPKDEHIEFDALIGRVSILRTFDLGEMQFQGRLEL